MGSIKIKQHHVELLEDQIISLICHVVTQKARSGVLWDVIKVRWSMIEFTVSSQLIIFHPLHLYYSIFLGNEGFKVQWPRHKQCLCHLQHTIALVIYPENVMVFPGCRPQQTSHLNTPHPILESGGISMNSTLFCMIVSPVGCAKGGFITLSLKLHSGMVTWRELVISSTVWVPPKRP